MNIIFAQTKENKFEQKDDFIIAFARKKAAQKM